MCQAKAHPGLPPRFLLMVLYRACGTEICSQRFRAPAPARSTFAKLSVVLVAFCGVRIQTRNTHCLLALRRAETPTPRLHIKFSSLTPASLLVRLLSRARAAAVTADLALTKYPPEIDIRRQSLRQVTNLPFSARLTLGSVHSLRAAVATGHYGISTR